MYGLSTDSVADLSIFAEEQELNFKLLSDPDGSAAKKYGVMTSRGFANRITFVLDDKGVLRHIEKKVQVKSHGDDLISVIKKLKK